MKKMKWRGAFSVIVALASITMFGLLGCELELGDKDSRLAYDTLYPVELAENTPVADVSDESGLTILFHSKGKCSSDQQVIIHGTSSSKNVNLVSGYFGDWASWDVGINDNSATGGTYGSFKKFYTAFTGDDYCVFVFSVPASGKSTVSCYLNGDLACEWKEVTSTFASAMIDSITLEGISVCESTELTLQGKLWYVPATATSVQAIQLCNWLESEE